MKQSTPMPWTLETTVSGVHILDEKSAVILEDHDLMLPLPDAHKMLALIVRAVNSHDALIEALEGLMKQIERFDPGGCVEGREISGKNVDRLREARAALSLARKETP